MGERRYGRFAHEKTIEALVKQNAEDRRQDQESGRTPRPRISREEAAAQSRRIFDYRDRTSK